MNEPLAPPTPVADSLPFTVLIDEAWRSTRAYVRTILLPAGLLLAPAALLMQVLVGLWNMSLVGAGAAAADFGRFCGVLAIGAVALLVVGIYYKAIYGAAMIAAVRAVGGEAPSVRTALRFYVRPRVWGTDLLAGILTFFGLAACVIPGLLLAAAWSLRLPVMVREGRFGWDALRRSWELLEHNPSRQLLRHPLLKVLVLFVLGAVLVYATSMVVQMPALIVNQVVMMRAMTRGEGVDPQALMRATLWLSVPAGVLAALVQLAVQLYVDFVVAFLYLDQVRRKEGTDLGLALDRLLGGTAAPLPPPAPLG